MPSPWYLARKAAKIAKPFGSKLRRIGRVARTRARGMARRSPLTRRGRRYQAHYWRRGRESGLKWGRRVKVAAPIAALGGFAYLGHRQFKGPKEKFRTTLNYSQESGDIMKLYQNPRFQEAYAMARDEIQKAWYSAAARIVGRGVKRTLGRKASKRFGRYAAKLGTSKVGRYIGKHPVKSAVMGAGTGGLLAGGAMARRRRRRMAYALPSGDVRKGIVGRELALRAWRAARKHKRNIGLGGAGVGAFLLGRATKPARRETYKEKQVIYKPYPYLKETRRRVKKFSHLGGANWDSRDKRAEAMKLLKEVIKDKRNVQLRKRRDFGQLVNAIGQAQVLKILR